VCSCGAGPHPDYPHRCIKGHAIQGNPFARKHETNLAHRNAYLAKLVADYAPRTTVLQWTCEDLADIRERLEGVRKGSTEHARLNAMGTDLVATLEASRSRDQRADDAHLADLTPDQLIERTTVILRRLLETRDAEQHAHEYIEKTADAHRQQAQTGGDLIPLDDDAAPPPPAPERCQFCHQAPCVGPDHHAYDVLHWNDPAEAKKRDDRATQEMFVALGRQRTGDPWVR
jgi:hypothetical protein